MSDIVERLRKIAKVHAAECDPTNLELVEESTCWKAASLIERLTAEVERLNSLVNYEVVTADPEGYWLCPLNVTDPALWAWMLLPSPVDEIDRLRRIPETASREVVQLDSAELKRGWASGEGQMTINKERARHALGGEEVSDE